MSKTLMQVLQEQGIELTSSSSGRYVAHCMFHEGDNTPSFTVYPNDSYYCFSCEAWGDSVKFLVDYKKMPHKEALEYVGIDAETIKPTKKQVIKVTNTVDTWKFLGEVVEKYHQFLLTTPGAVTYLYSRGLTDETIKKHKIGYTDGRALNLQLAWEFQIGTDVGLINKAGYEALSHRIVIPNLLDRGECDFMVGRTVTNDKIKYLGIRSPKPLFGFYQVRQSPIIFLVEGQFDYLILSQWGFPTVAVGGSHLTKEQQGALDLKKLIVIPDRDAIGTKLANSLKKRFPNASILQYDMGKDISEFSQQDGAREKFIQLVKDQNVWIASTSTKTLDRFFPNLSEEILSPLIWKQPA